ncbi:MAG: hypothetical protein INR62_02265, partial [Rhodospirillales bacterium]|nr:hypothetical protein [Acetobacter sp.]
MKPFPARRPGRDSRGGFILVIVLALLVLITALVIGFLGHTTSQTKSVTSYSAQTDSLLLGDVAVNLVKSQIDDATNLPTGNLWASQPGAIRVADGSGTQTLYKLYSSADLKPSAAPLTLKDAVRTQDLPSASDPNDWATSPLWTDLNAPAKRADGTNGYPIIDVVNDPADLPAATSFSVDNST